MHGETTEVRLAPSAPPIQIKLVVVNGPDEGLEAAVEGELIIGTGPDGMVLSDTTVSRGHTRVQVDAGRILIQDLGSTNGTLVDGARIKEADLIVGSLITLGATTLALRPRWHLRETPPSSASRFGELYGCSIAMREVFGVLERVAASDITLLVDGETGTGKELVARSVHHASPRTRRPYVVFDCAAVAPQLAEAELFGHQRGAFTGASAERVGVFEQANGGTLFLDELGELPLDLQPKLLRVLESREVRRVGDHRVRPVDVRVIAATNRDLKAEVQRGRFRLDLLHRLDVISVRLPPLRQRPEDIPGLTETLLMGKLPAGDRVEGDNLARLIAYSWPGNVRELRNVLVRAAELARHPDGNPRPFRELVINLGSGSCEPATLGPSFPGIDQPLPFKDAKELLLASFERAYLEALLKRHRGNITEAAQAAGVSRKHLHTLVNKLRGSACALD